MTAPGKLTITASGDRRIIMIRAFNAPRHLVFEALIKPELIRRWLTGPPGWTMPVCEFGTKPGDSYRYVWEKDGGTQMGMGGKIVEIKPPERLVATEKFDQAWYPGEATSTFVLTEMNGITTLTQTVEYDSAEARDGVLKSPMEQGVAHSYNQLEGLLEQQQPSL